MKSSQSSAVFSLLELRQYRMAARHCYRRAIATIAVLGSLFSGSVLALSSYPADCVADQQSAINGEWRLWYVDVEPNNNSGCTVNDKSVANGYLTLDVTLNPGTTAASFMLPKDFGLDYSGDGDGDVALIGDGHVEALDANGNSYNVANSDVPQLAQVKMDVENDPIGACGQPLYITYLSQGPSTQTINLSLRSSAIGQSGYLAKYFARSTAADFPLISRGLVLQLGRPTSVVTSTPYRIKVTLNIGTSNTPDLAVYNSFIQSRFTDYANRFINSELVQTNQSIAQAYSAIANTSSQLVSVQRIKAEADTLNNSQQQIVSNYSNRKPFCKALSIPKPDEYAKLQDVNHGLSALNNTGNYLVINPTASIVYYPWNASSPWKLDESSMGVNENIAQPMIVNVPTNAYEGAGLVLQNLATSNLSSLNLSLSNLTSNFGDQFPAEKFDIRVVKSWWTPSASTIDLGDTCNSPACLKDMAVLVPELLLKDDSLVNVTDTKSNFLKITTGGATQYIDISDASQLMPADAQVADTIDFKPFALNAYHARELLFTIDSHGVMPGTYTGNITLSYVDNGTTKQYSIPLTINVKPFVLVQSPMDYGIYYHAQLPSGQVPADYAPLHARAKNDTQYRVEMRNIFNHGIKYPLQFTDDVGTNLEAHLLIRMQEGLPCDKLFFQYGMAYAAPANGLSVSQVVTNGLNLKSRVANAVSSYCAQSDIYMYGFDEANSQDQFNSQAPYWNALHQNGLKIFNSGYIGAFDMIQAANTQLDILNFSGTADSVEIGKWRSTGKSVYSYGNPQSGVPDPFSYRRNYGLYLWQKNYSGAFDFAYQEGMHHLSGSDESCSYSVTVGQPYCTPWNNFDSLRWLDHMFTYPTTNGVIDTLQWEAFREAVDDTRYLATLLTLIAQNATSTSAQQADSWLAQLKVNADFDPADTRATMGQYIEAIYKEINQPPVFSAVTVAASGNTIAVAGQANDPEGYLGSIEVKLDNSNWQNVGRADSWQASFTNVASGNHTVYYRATDYWGAVTSQQSAVIVQAAQTITVTSAAPFSASYGSSFSVGASASSGLSVAITVSGGCSNIGNIITMTSGSTPCTVNYDQAGNSTYRPAPQVSSATGASKASQTITVTTPAPASAGYGSAFTVVASASSSLPVSVSASGGCSNSGNTVTMTSATVKCTVKYNQAGDSNYTAAIQVSSTTTATKGTQIITVTTPAPASAAYKSTFNVAATANSGLTVTIAVSGGCSISGNTVTMTSGTNACTVKYNRASTTNYTAATQVTNTTTPIKLNQTITVTTAAPSSAAKGGSFTVAASASSALAVTVAASPSTVCTYSSSTKKVTIKTTATTGATCTTTFSQSGNSNYNSAATVSSGTIVN